MSFREPFHMPFRKLIPPFTLTAISNTGLCLRRSAVYSVKKHIYSCQNKDYKGIDVKVIMSENDPANLRLYKEFYIRKCKPTLNSREEWTAFADLLF